jgi:hypothetical protein
MTSLSVQKEKNERNIYASSSPSACNIDGVQTKKSCGLASYIADSNT